jgi:hypothetical protein
MVEIARGFYSEEEIHIMTMMITDMTHPVMDFNGSLVMFYSTNPSGNNVTVQVNSIVNVLYHMMAFEKLDGRDFFNHVRLMTYGDDAIASVRDSPMFNFGEIKRLFETQDIKITLPDKTDGEDVKYLDWSEVDFLKRTSRWCENLKTSVGVLHEDSIHKRFLYHIPSNVEDERSQMSSTIASAMHDWFFHGQEIYEDRRAKLKLVLEDVGWTDGILDITFDERTTDWFEKYTNTNGD